ncbi:SHOCT domain-containing protein [Kitasatospora sp. NPDC048540]|uniref:SHOCT domain-containing protein n=1 Tax=unclassified Kitasatospora TaxID=2633591 RepID=UPI00053AF6F3|nr:SHOCT domain-containing protein [Kitasatospora sp. MBT63]
MIATSLAGDYPLLNLFWTIAEIFLWVLWIFLLIRVLDDVFRDDSLSGGAKAAWAILVVLLPFLGIFIYLIVRGKGMGERSLKQAQKQEEQLRSYIRETAGSTPGAEGGTGGTGGHVEELAKLAELKNRGDITEQEYQQAKAKVLS